MSATTAPKGAKWAGEVTCPDLPNGEFTIISPTGARRTVRIRRQAADASFQPGQRIISVLTGPDNTDWGSWTSVGMLRQDGSVMVWRKFQGSAHEKTVVFAVRALRAQQKGADLAGVEILASSTCCRCNRRLTVPESILQGMGPECATR